MTVLADRYELADPLGSGGMARVIRAHDRVLQRDVAIKMLREDFDPSGVMAQRFVREARLAGALSHPSIVQVYDAGVHDGAPWMAMELVAGPTLADRLREQGRLSADEAVGIITPVLAGLHTAHEGGVVHRDIKPANIMLSPAGPKLTDFGIAKSLMTTDLDLTAVDQFMGTPKYIAPEVALGEQATGRADLYSAAVVLWEALAGHAPYRHEHPITLAMMHHTDPLPRIGDLRPDLPRALVQTLESALQKDPADRQADADTMRRQLLGELPPPPPTTPPASPRTAQAAAAASVPTQQLSRTSQPTAGQPAAPMTAASTTSPVQRRPVPAADDDGPSGWLVAVAVGVLTLMAVIGFTLVTDGDTADPQPAPSISAPATPTAPTTTPADDAVPTAPSAGDQPGDDAAATPAPQPTDVAPTPTAEPAPPEPTGQPTPEAEPTAEPTDPEGAGGIADVVDDLTGADGPTEPPDAEPQDRRDPPPPAAAEPEPTQ